MIKEEFDFSIIGSVPKQKVIFCDIDGTLLDNNKLIHNRTENVIRKLINENQDYHFALASGRTLADELMIYKQLKLKNTGILISCNGAQIYSLKSHKIIYEKTIEPKIAELVYLKYLDLVKNSRVSLMVSYSNSSAFIDNIPKEQWDKYHLSNIKLKDKFDSNNIVLISLFYLEDNLEDMNNYLSKFDLEIIKGRILTAITAKNVSKATAVLYVKDYYDLDIKNIAVIGDSKNDLCMFKIPNIFSITYSNAKDYLKKIATKIIDLPESEFIAEGLIQFQNYINNKS